MGNREYRLLSPFHRSPPVTRRDRNMVAGLDPAGLTDNGGTTATIGLLTNSAALEAVPVVPTNYCTLTDGLTPITTDQRGVFRPQGRACDIGAFEAVLPDDDSAYSQLSGGNTSQGIRL